MPMNVNVNVNGNVNGNMNVNANANANVNVIVNVNACRAQRNVTLRPCNDVYCWHRSIRQIPRPN